MIAPDELSVFTTVLVQGRRVRWLDQHLTRLAAHAEALNIPYPGDDVIVGEMFQAIDPHATQLIRISVGPIGHTITPRAANIPTPQQYEGAHLIVTDVRVNPRLATLKTSHQVPYQLARTVATKQKAFEGLLVDDDGYVVDGSRSSPLLFCDDTLISLEGGLRGITREQVLLQAQALGIRIAREKRKVHQLDGLLLVAGSGIGLVPGAKPNDERVKRLIRHFKIPAVDEKFDRSMDS